jgi:hypothetical protein
MHVIRHILGLIPPWAKPVLLGSAVAFALWKAIMSSVLSRVQSWYFDRFDNATLLILPTTPTKLPDIAKIRRKSESKTLRSLQRLRERDLAQSIHLNEHYQMTIYG